MSNKFLGRFVSVSIPEDEETRYGRAGVTNSAVGLCFRWYPHGIEIYWPSSVYEWGGMVRHKGRN